MRRRELFIFIGIIGFLAIFFLVYLFVMFLSPATPETTNPPAASSAPINNFNEPIPAFNTTSSSLPNITPNILPQFKITKEQIIELLPISTNIFDIEYLSTGDIFAITIKQNPYEANKALAEQWFKDQGFDPSKLNIYWNAYPEVER